MDSRIFQFLHCKKKRPSISFIYQKNKQTNKQASKQTITTQHNTTKQNKTQHKTNKHSWPASKALTVSVPKTDSWHRQILLPVPGSSAKLCPWRPLGKKQKLVDFSTQRDNTRLLWVLIRTRIWHKLNVITLFVHNSEPPYYHDYHVVHHIFLFPINNTCKNNIGSRKIPKAVHENCSLRRYVVLFCFIWGQPVWRCGIFSWFWAPTESVQTCMQDTNEAQTNHAASNYDYIYDWLKTRFNWWWQWTSYGLSKLYIIY